MKIFADKATSIRMYDCRQLATRNRSASIFYSSTRPLLLSLMIASLFWLGGCTTVDVDQPLTDENNSEIDKRLIGHWQFVRQGNDLDPTSQFVIGRAKDKRNTLELVFTELDSEERVQIAQLPLYATTIGDESYLSLLPPTKTDKQSYILVCYKFTLGKPGNRDNDQLRVFNLNPKMIAAAIADKQLAGKVIQHENSGKRTTDNPFQQEFREVRIAAEPAQLREFLKENAATCLVGEAWVFRRVPPILK